MPGGFHDGTLRAQLHTDIQGAWSGLTRIFDDDPVEAATAAQLPYARVELVPPIMQTYGSGALKDVEQRYVYDIHGVFARPGTGTVIASVQTQINALAAALMGAANQVYAGIGNLQRLVTEADWDDGMESGESAYRVRVRFEVACFGNYA